MSDPQLTLLASSLLIAAMIASSYYVIKTRDLVYASGALAVLGGLNAVFIALLGYGLVAAFLVIVYVGAAVMFIIISVSMLGGAPIETWEPERGVIPAAAVAGALGIIVLSSGLYAAYTAPGAPIDLGSVASIIVDKYLVVIAVIFVALAATLIEAIAIARRRL